MVFDRKPGQHGQRESLPAPEVLRQRQARVLRKEMAGCQRLGQGHQQPQIPAKRKAETGPRGGQGQQAPRLPVLPAEDGTLPHRAIACVDDPSPRRHLLVVSVQHPDSGAPLQKLPPMEEPTEDSVGDRPRGDPQAPRPHPGPGPYQHRGAARRRAVQPGGARFPCDNRRRSDGRPTGS